jgi:hypothetical protein
MSEGKNKKPEIEKIILPDEGVGIPFTREITDNTSDTTGDIPDFTTGDGESYKGSDSNDPESSE